MLVLKNVLSARYFFKSSSVSRAIEIKTTSSLLNCAAIFFKAGASAWQGAQAKNQKFSTTTLPFRSVRRMFFPSAVFAVKSGALTPTKQPEVAIDRRLSLGQLAKAVSYSFWACALLVISKAIAMTATVIMFLFIALFR